MASQSWDVEHYESTHNYVWKLGAPLIGLLSPQAGERILDLGCGAGQLAAEIVSAGAEVVGVDSSPAMIAQARINYPGIRFVLSGAAGFTDPEPFDAVFSNAALHWMKPPEAVVDSIARALKTGGRFVAEMGGRGNIGQVVAALEAILGKEQVAARNPWYYPAIGEYASLLEQHGLDVENALLFDRPTRVDGEAGLRQWLEMFATSFLEGLDRKDRERLFEEMESRLRPSLFCDGAWYIDYRRLRIVARRNRLF
jgi:SAM-dependent methyltransferase